MLLFEELLGMKTMKTLSQNKVRRGFRPASYRVLVLLVTAGASWAVFAQVNSGSNGSDGALNPATDLVINMADHPDGIYQYTSVNIPFGVKVSFLPNANNTPVVWLIQSNCTIAGDLLVNGVDTTNIVSGAKAGPGGWGGGNAALSPLLLPGAGLGPGGGTVGTDTTYLGGNASFATTGDCNTIQPPANTYPPQFPAGPIYGNIFGLPLVGGSGGSGGRDVGGGGGGGAILVAATGTITVSGSIRARGGSGGYWYEVTGFGNYWSGFAGAGSGGAIRLVATTLSGGGTLDASGGQALFGITGSGYAFNSGGSGRIRLDGLNILFNGPTTGIITSGFQPIIIPPANQALSLAIQSVAGIAVPQNPTGTPVPPDVIVPGQQANPVSIVIRCVNIPLNTAITVDIKPADGPAVRVVGANNAGTQASSTATVSVNMPRGAGTIQAKAVSGIAGTLGASFKGGEKFRHYAQTGLTADREIFAKMEITATLGSGQEIAYVTESGKRFVLPRN
jgi:hypothetical protein